MAKKKETTAPAIPRPNRYSFEFIRGQEAAKRATIIALAGGHSIAYIGPAGNGKSLLAAAARRLQADLDPAGDDDTPSRLQYVELRIDQGKLAGRSLHDLPNYEEARDCDLHVEVPGVPFRELTGRRLGTSDDDVLRQLRPARQAAQIRIHEPKYFDLSDGCLQLAKQAYDELGLTPRSFAKIVEVSRTIADLSYDGAASCRRSRSII